MGRDANLIELFILPFCNQSGGKTGSILPPDPQISKEATMTYEVQRPEGLPPHQPPIETSSVTRLRQNLRLLLDVKKTTGYPMMALIVSWPGYGKTIAVYAFCNNLAEQSQSTKPRAIPFRIQDDPTPRSIAESLLLAYGERADDSRYKLMAKSGKLSRQPIRTCL